MRKARHWPLTASHWAIMPFTSMAILQPIQPVHFRLMTDLCLLAQRVPKEKEPFAKYNETSLSFH